MKDLEKLCASIDNEHSSENVHISDWYQNALAQQKWQRYHLIGDILRQETSTLPENFSQQIMIKIQKDTTTPSKTQTTQTTAPRPANKSLRYFLQASLSAGVMFFTIFGVQQWSVYTSKSSAPTVIETGSLMSYTVPVNLAVEQPIAPKLPADYPEIELKFEAFQQYQQSLANDGLGLTEFDFSDNHHP